MPEVRPVKKYRTPKYPTKYEALRQPDILRRVPRRWQNSPVVMTALSMTLFLTAAGCGMRNGGVSSAPGAASASKDAPENTQTPSAVAPLFSHGGGTGVFGCSSVVAPYVLSEDEALELIISEARSYGGLELTAGNTPEAGGVKVDWVKLYGADSRAEKKAGDNVVDITFDAAAGDGKIAVEFVSKEDMDNMVLPEEYLSMAASVEEYEFKAQAESVRNALADQEPDRTIGVFYEPYSYEDVTDAVDKYDQSFGDKDENTDWDAYYDGQQQVIREISEENLRAQVRDFIDWLKAQGII